MFEMSDINEYTNIMLSLRNIFPSELIRVIIELYWYLRNEPVLLVYAPSEGIWREMFNISLRGDNILRKMFEIKPNLRFCLMERNSNGHYHLIESNFKCPLISLREGTCPRSLNLSTMWIAILQLIPGPSWNYAMLYPDSEAKYASTSIRTYNPALKQFVGSELTPYYNSKEPNEVLILRWFNDSLNHPDFLAVQNSLL
jgi:hypothetical protein